MDDLAPRTDDGIPETSMAIATKPWGFWATIGFSLVVIISFVLIQAAVAIGYVLVRMQMQPQPDLDALTRDLAADGLLLSLASWISMPFCLGLVVLFVKLRRGWTVREYLALKPVPVRTMLGWLGISLVFVVASDGLTYLLGRPIVPEYMRTAYRTAYCLPLLWATLLIASPVLEEAFFRGFMIPGILQSRLGAVGATVITAAGWAIVHIQYDFYAIAHIFLGGVLFGVARLRTRSLYPTLVMHSLWNLCATIEVVFCQSLS